MMPASPFKISVTCEKRSFSFLYISRFMIFPCNIVVDIQNWRCDGVKDGMEILH